MLTLPGSLRRFTGSYEVGSLQPAQFPVTQWLSDTVPGLFRDELTLDQRAKYEYLTVLGLQTFYKGGSISPVAVWVANWNYAPAMEWQLFVQYLPTPNLIVEPGLRIFWTNGRTVDDRYSIGRMTGRSEFQLKTTYQF